MGLQNFNFFTARGVQTKSFPHRMDADLSPDLMSEMRIVGGKKIRVIRDDILSGGTKQRGLGGLLRHHQRQGTTHFVYSSPFCGFAQVALSYLCQQLNLKCTLFSERDPVSKPFHALSYSSLAAKYGAQIFFTDSLSQAEAGASLFCEENPQVFKIPLGFNCPEFYHCYTQALRTQWLNLRMSLNSPPRVLWLPVGSGTLARSFLQVVDLTQTRIHGVNVHVLDASDPRLRLLQESPDFLMFEAPMPFHDLSLTRPEFPSNPFYDAKLEAVIAEHGCDGDVWWNVAR